MLRERGDLLVAPGELERTILITAPRSGGAPLFVRWEVRSGGEEIGRGEHAAVPGRDRRLEAPLRLRLPEDSRPHGLDLDVTLNDDSGRLSARRFAFTVYPAPVGATFAARFGDATIALLDPSGRIGGPLERLGATVVPVAVDEDLRRAESDLIVVGPGGFSRGRESVGPMLAERARAGTPVLLLGQPSLPSTLTDRLRLWPAFRHGPEIEYLIASGHPVLRGLTGEGPGASLTAGDGRPYLPPVHGNFRILAGTRVRRAGTWQEAVGIVEFPLGNGTILALQSPVANYGGDANARILLINALGYLLGERPPLRRTFLYGAGADALPDCLALLNPDAPTTPADLEHVEVLLVPADWRATRMRASAALPPAARVASFLKGGGTVVLIDPQSLVADYLGALVGEPVEFTDTGSLDPGRTVEAQGAAVSILQGIAPGDLALFERPGEREFALRTHRGDASFEPLLVVPGFSLYRVGRGTLAAISFPRSLDCRSSRTGSLLSRLLTNLGVPLDSGPPPVARALNR